MLLGYDTGVFSSSTTSHSSGKSLILALSQLFKKKGAWLCLWFFSYKFAGSQTEHASMYEIKCLGHSIDAASIIPATSACPGAGRLRSQKVDLCFAIFLSVLKQGHQQNNSPLPMESCGSARMTPVLSMCLILIWFGLASLSYHLRLRQCWSQQRTSLRLVPRC